ncbi:histidine kinase [Natronomonas pharaonis DSM 2160]|uniref:histidine kinase n=1 Tax=Natronomonas pharaonis (strain ATCC 35678 / DSM 2160 / CIP 103997 / JCM 8858 / NBRC 14720 / NCIMB 2260 / Gabara) TaxID=348780 RepID=A0A1U7EU41_NATPD|nr:ATP-binding protein [Natronomonas pharaonis]CAI48456.1 histidine kinase [Natronomonas pharaonis DSM 2160]
MQSRDGQGMQSSAASATVLCAVADGAEPVASALDDGFRVRTLGPDSDVLDVLDGGDIDCLVADEHVLSNIEAISEHVGHVIVFSGSVAPRLSQAAARRSGWDVVYRDAAPVETPGTEVDRLHERLETMFQGSTEDIGDTVLEVARLLMSAAPDEVDTRIEWGLESLGEALDADRCVLYAYGEDDRFSRVSGWQRTGAASPPDAVPVEQFPDADTLLQFSTVSVAAPPSEPPAAEYRSRHDIGTFVAVPVVIDWELEYVLAACRSGTEPWPASVQRQLRTAGELVGHTLRRHRRRNEIERKNERLERFASVISHDLQNPLNVILGYADLAMESRDPDDIERIATAAERMETILEELQTLVQESRALGETEPVAISTVVERARSSVAMPKATVDIEEIGVAEADPGRLRQAFENLLRNAVEHAGPDVTVRVVPINGGFAVEDDGPGIHPDKREAVFEEGHTDGDGTGLGLSIVRTVVEAHGWSVTATDAEDGGARFEVTDVDFHEP